MQILTPFETTLIYGGESEQFATLDPLKLIAVFSSIGALAGLTISSIAWRVGVSIPGFDQSINLFSAITSTAMLATGGASFGALVYLNIGNENPHFAIFCG